MVENQSSTRPLKRARKNNRVTADLPDFLCFPSDASAPPMPFRDAIRRFVETHARQTQIYQPPVLPCLVSWQILFRVGNLETGRSDPPPFPVVLHVVEEDVTRSSRSVYCDQCRVVGWSGHPVCRRRYHFIIRSQSGGGMGSYDKCCSMCGNPLHLFHSRCKWCNSEFNSDEFEPWVNSQLDDNTHLLHGLVHANGYGHLLTVNGREGGSEFLSGCNIMDFWDRLCTALSVRKVSVMDVSTKYGLEYRLLHAITKGHSWYSKWGYEFGSGSYALTLEAYKEAVNSLSTMPLSHLLFQGRQSRSRLQNIIACYRSLSDVELLTLGDLSSFLLRMIHESQEKSMPGRFESVPSRVLCSWSRNDVERVQRAMIKVLTAVAGKSDWVSRRVLKCSVIRQASPELLDYCLKHLAGKVVSDAMVVETRFNQGTGDLDFRLHPVVSSIGHDSGLDMSCPSSEQIRGDLKFLFDSLFNPETVVNYLPEEIKDNMLDASTKLLDCKQFVKDYKPESKNPFAVSLWCHLELVDQPKGEPSPPPELLILPLSATIADLKVEAGKAFEQVYIVFKKLQVEQLLGYGQIKDDMTVKLLVGTNGTVCVRGRCPVRYGLNRFRMERGTESWVVECTCGATDDDGERMLACDSCGVWHHTRCAGIDDSKAIPAKFVCKRCANKKPSVPNFRKGTRKAASSLSNGTCREEAYPNGRMVVSSGIS